MARKKKKASGLEAVLQSIKMKKSWKKIPAFIIIAMILASLLFNVFAGIMSPVGSTTVNILSDTAKQSQANTEAYKGLSNK